jgi:hypothetical protein
MASAAGCLGGGDGRAGGGGGQACGGGGGGGERVWLRGGLGSRWRHGDAIEPGAGAERERKICGARARARVSGFASQADAGAKQRDFPGSNLPGARWQPSLFECVD